MNRRSFTLSTTALSLAAALPVPAFAQQRAFAPTASDWRTFEVTTRLEIEFADVASRAWVPAPVVDTDWQESQATTWTGNMREAVLVTDPVSGARMVRASWADDERSPRIEVVSRVRTRNRATDWSRATRPQAPADLASDLAATDLIRTDGIVAATAASITADKRTDVDKVRAIYDWIVSNTYRDPAVKGCGIGDIKAMLETRNLGGKCADLNALFVGLCRASGIPARDIYGIRVAKSAFGYKELGAGSPDISKAQHCRAEVWLAAYGWVAMDPADVAKVMRQETAEWIRDRKHEVVAPVDRALFGSWEGNWMGYNFAHDVALPGSQGAKLGFFMYPQAETRGERVDSLDPDTFRYRITAREVTA